MGTEKSAKAYGSKGDGGGLGGSGPPEALNFKLEVPMRLVLFFPEADISSKFTFGNLSEADADTLGFTRTWGGVVAWAAAAAAAFSFSSLTDSIHFALSSLMFFGNGC